MPEERGLIQFRCVAEGHLDPKSNTSDMLTIHQGKWACCPFDVRANGHKWEPTGGVSVNDIRRLVDRERNARAKAGGD